MNAQLMSPYAARYCCLWPRALAIGALLAISIAPAQNLPDDRDWAEILTRYVNPEHRVDYQSLRDRDRPKLDHFVQKLAQKWSKIDQNERKSTLINAYNALTIRWILENYPVESIWRTPKPFTEKRQVVDGERVSLDDIETELRRLDPRIHAALVCAARSCPPLRRGPYRASDVDRQLDENMREWLAMPDRNSFDARARVAKVSKIFDWYQHDFDRLGGVRAVIEKYAPVPVRDFKIEYQRYRWGLNDVSELGSRYSDWNFYIDKLKN